MAASGSLIELRNSRALAAGRQLQAAVRSMMACAQEVDGAELGELLIVIREAGIDPLEAAFATGVRRFDKSGEYAADGALSVMMPVYNEERTLAIILEHVLDRPEVGEVIAVDDGSTDRSWEILTELASKDRRVRPLAREARRRPLRLQLGGEADLQGRLVLPDPLFGRSARRTAARLPARGRRGALASTRRSAGSARLQRRAGDGRARPRPTGRTARMILRPCPSSR